MMMIMSSDEGKICEHTHPVAANNSERYNSYIIVKHNDLTNENKTAKEMTNKNHTITPATTTKSTSTKTDIRTHQCQ